MAFQGVLHIDGVSYPLRWVAVMIDRNTDQKGRPASAPRWEIKLSLDAMDDSTFLGWMVDPTMQKDGKVILNRTDEDATFKEIEFKRTYCTSHTDEFFSDMDFMETQLHIHGGELTVNQATLQL